MPKIIVMEKPQDWGIDLEGIEIITPKAYFGNSLYQNGQNLKVINLCDSYQYQSIGYYVSLLAEARGHKVIPEISALQEFRLPALMRSDTADFDEIIQQCFKNHGTDSFEFVIFFGKTRYDELSRLGSMLFNLFQIPLLKAQFVKRKKWQLQSLKPIHINDLDDLRLPVFLKALENYLSGKKIFSKNYARRKYDLAILVNPEDENAPSNAKALQLFMKAAEKKGFNCEFLTKHDYGKLMQFDALFIRDTTAVTNHTFRFAKKAEAEGLAVIDDPISIMRCTNKVYLSELLHKNNVLVPKYWILRKDEANKKLPHFEYPVILKQPDGSFSLGVKKVSNEKELKEVLRDFFQKSELLIAQEFMPTDFDWRVGVLDSKVLFVCKYYMATDHWQIYNWKKEGGDSSGLAETIDIQDAPHDLLKTAIRACRLIGNSLYGVDIKEIDGKYYVIEINDNPNIDAGVEDLVDKQIYDKVIDSLLEKVKTN